MSEIAADLITASFGFLLMSASSVSLFYFTGREWERFFHRLFRLIVLTSGAAFCFMWIRIAWFHVVPHNWSIHNRLDNFLFAYNLQFLLSRYVFVFFAYPLAETAFLLQRTDHQGDEKIMPV